MKSKSQLKRLSVQKDGKKWSPSVKPYIVCAANRLGKVIVCGPRHCDKIMLAMIHRLEDHEYWGPSEQGFIDQFGRFYTREEAMQVARQNNQIRWPDDMLSKTALHSEDLY